ncbi:hypothetical protein B0T14DRAFT_82326 [Immersiella caudata]|uniref:Uncharacterized protein n=1 Tax=Immersiella caudata TaxID=314043 RepID=A0AA39XGX2_9PEZI|nr:hypothetical protein B0T14DRAFT_82326 [Immersiella caudata]
MATSAASAWSPREPPQTGSETLRRRSRRHESNPVGRSSVEAGNRASSSSRDRARVIYKGKGKTREIQQSPPVETDRATHSSLQDDHGAGSPYPGDDAYGGPHRGPPPPSPSPSSCRHRDETMMSFRPDDDSCGGGIKDVIELQAQHGTDGHDWATQQDSKFLQSDTEPEHSASSWPEKSEHDARGDSSYRRGYVPEPRYDCRSSYEDYEPRYSTYSDRTRHEDYDDD